MKTQMINFKKLAATVIAALLISTGSYTQPNSGNTDLVSLVNLESIISLTEESLRYVAPAVPESEAYFAEFERLDNMAAAAEVSLRYEAPAVNDADVTDELERMDCLTDATEASLRYAAPVATETDVTPEMSRLDFLAAATEASSRYAAPAVDETIANNYNNSFSTEIMLVHNN